MTATLSVDNDGVTVRNTFSRRRLAWGDIVSVEIATPLSIWNVKLTFVMRVITFRVHGRRSPVKAAGSATLSNRLFVDELAAVRAWCLASGTPANRVTPPTSTARSRAARSKPTT